MPIVRMTTGTLVTATCGNEPAFVVSQVSSPLRSAASNLHERRACADDPGRRLRDLQRLVKYRE
jgi:hypothetical protein